MTYADVKRSAFGLSNGTMLDTALLYWSDERMIESAYGLVVTPGALPTNCASCVVTSQ